jgi:RHS repeat-associated protein
MLKNIKKKISSTLFYVFFILFFFIYLASVESEGGTGYTNCTPYYPECPVYEPANYDVGDTFGDSQCSIIGPVPYYFNTPPPDCGIIGPIRYWNQPTKGWTVVCCYQHDYLQDGYPVVEIRDSGQKYANKFPIYHFYFRDPNVDCGYADWEVKCCVWYDFYKNGYPVVAKKPTGETYLGKPVYWFYFQDLNYHNDPECVWKCDRVEYSVDCNTCGIVINSTISEQENTHITCSQDPPDVNNIGSNYCIDNDGDGHYPTGSCGTPDDDCNDNDASVYTGTSELCDGKDNNCNGQIDEGCSCEDSDGDGYTTCTNDCNDSNQAINPAASEACDGIDNNCDGQVDETCIGEEDKCDEKSNSTDMGSSANLASGNLYHSQQVSGSYSTGNTVNITISYNSLDTTIGPFGRGWTHNYNINLTHYNTTIILAEKDGKRVNFSSNGKNSYLSDTLSGKHATITQNPDGTYTLVEKSGMQYNFDSKGRLSSITDRNGNTLTLTYTGDNLTLITDSSGRETVLTYDENKVISVIDPAGRTTTFTYTGDYLSTITDSMGGTWTYTYDENGKMLTKIDPLGHVTTYAYDSEGRLITSQDPAGNTKAIFYDRVNQMVYVTEKNGAQWRYTYDSSLNVLLEVRDPKGNITTYQYDSSGNLISKTEPGEITTTYIYDSKGNTLSQVDTLGNVTIYTYNEFGQILSVTDPDGNTTTYTYNENGNLLEEIDARGNKTIHTYGPHGERLSTTDPNGNTTTYTYDQYGNLASVTNALGQTVTYTYDIMGNLLSMTDANGNTTTYEYNLRDRLIKEVRPDGGIITYEYDLAGNRTAIIDANGNKTTFTYDSLNRLIKTTDPEGNTINYTYDPEGNITSMTIKDSSGNIMTSTTYTYDIYNRLIKTTYADGTYTEQSYDVLGNIISKTDENGNITTFTYDALNRLVSVTDPTGGVTSYTYDSRNNLLTVTDANSNTTTYTYDSLNRLISTTSPDTGTTTYSYDPNGNLISKTDANGVTITYTYDALNRLTAIQFPDPTQNITYTYDDTQYQNSIGRLTSMTDPSGTTWYDYDKMGRVIKETKQIDGLYYRTQYSYDLNGNLKTVTYPGGREITYTYNQLNKVTSVKETYYGVTKTLANNITYLPFGDMTSMTQGNGIVTTRTYNNRMHLTSLLTQNSELQTLNSFSYTRDNTGNITAITDNLEPSKSKTYTYDAVYRLTTATGPWGTITYSYDPVGNRTSETTDTGSTSYTYTANQLTSTSGEKVFSFSYDSNGNTIAENTRQYIYNQNQRLIKAMDGSNVLGEYVYNGNGQRVKKYTNNGTRCTIYHYDQNGLLIAESTTTGTITAEYVYLNGQPLTKIEDNNIYFYHNDHLGTPVLMTHESGSIVWEGEFLPFGEALSITGTITNNLRFPGQYYDSETGLHYNYFRDYKPEIGRYVEADPIGIDRGRNHLYVYVKNNPIKYTDKKGLFPGGLKGIIKRCGEWFACRMARTAYCEAKFGSPCRAGCTRYDPDTQEYLWKLCLYECSINYQGCLLSSACPYDGIKLAK